MKNFVKLLGIIAFITMVGFVMVACGEDNENFVGTWEDDGVRLVFTATNWTLTIAGTQMGTGTYTVSGNTADLRVVVGGVAGPFGTATISGNTLTLTMAGEDFTLTRQ